MKEYVRRTRAAQSQQQHHHHQIPPQQQQQALPPGMMPTPGGMVPTPGIMPLPGGMVPTPGTMPQYGMVPQAQPVNPMMPPMPGMVAVGQKRPHSQTAFGGFAADGAKQGPSFEGGFVPGVRGSSHDQLHKKSKNDELLSMVEAGGGRRI